MHASLSALLRELERFGAEHDARTEPRAQRMLNITPDTGEFLTLLVRALRARRVLEIGTSNGYSTLWLAEAVRPLAGQVVTIEVQPAKAELARANFQRGGLDAFIELHVTDAGAWLKTCAAAPFALIFLDASRGQYVSLWPDLSRLLGPGGLLVVDNAVSHAPELAGFTDLVRSAPGYTTCLVPVGKGEFLALREAEACG
jgi:predicted O-methyltransferase YrrM